MFQQQTKWSRLLLVFFWILIYILVLSYLFHNFKIVSYYLMYPVSIDFIIKLVSIKIFSGKFLFIFLLLYLSLRYIKMLIIEVIDSLIDYVHSYIMWVYISTSLLVLIGTIYLTILFYILG